MLSIAVFMGVTSFSLASEAETTETSSDSNGAAYFSMYEDPKEGTRDYYIKKWNEAESNYERYNFSTKAKAKIIGMNLEEFKFFARCVEAEGEINGDDLTDKVLVACVVLNRVNCETFPEKSVSAVLRAPGQFEVVGADKDCHKPRTKDSEWAIMLAYEMVSRDLITSHLTYFNCINYMRNKADFGFFGNYFSCDKCDCKYCKKHDPDFKIEKQKIWSTHFYRPTDPNKKTKHSSYNHEKGYVIKKKDLKKKKK